MIDSEEFSGEIPLIPWWMHRISATDLSGNHRRTIGNLPDSDTASCNTPSLICRFPLGPVPKQSRPPPRFFPQSRQAGCFLPLENSRFSTLEPQTPCTRSACPQSRSVRAAAPTPGWAMPKPFQCCRPGNSIRSAHKKTIPQLHGSEFLIQF